MSGHSEQLPSRCDEGQQQPWIAADGMRVEGPIEQLGTNELLHFDLPAHRGVRTGERGE
jgi:hypothetical protein